MRRTVATLVAALLLGSAGWAGAQVRATGIIVGQVLDADGQPVPGVQVTTTSPALIGQQVAFTGADGAYRLPLLPPGVYRLEFRLQGFATIVRENVEVGVRRTTTLNVTMRLAAVEETITVTARSPLVDLKSTKRASEYSDELRNMLPEPRGVGDDLMTFAPEATVAAGDDPNSDAPSFFGSPDNSNAYQVDGVTVTDPGGGFQFPFYSPDWFETVELTTTGASAEYGKAMGSVFNVITKSGGNTYHGELNYFFQNNSFIDDNTEGITSEVADFTAARIDYRHDFSANVGGPVVRDKAWFFAGYQGFYESFRNPGVKFDQWENSDRFFGKLTWQVNPDNRVITSMMADTFTIGGRPGDPLVEPEATVFEPSMNITPNITWDSVLSPDAFLEVKYSGFYGFFDLVPVSEAPASFDLGTGVLSGAYWGHYTFDRARTNIQGSLSYFAEEWAGDHSFKFGAEWERNLTDDRSIFGPNAQGVHIIYYPYFGQPYLAYVREPDKDRNTSLINVTTLYAQDDWTIADRLTLNLGIRYDRWDIGYLDVSRGDEPTFNDLAPRLGINVDLLGDGRSSLYAFWGRFYEEAHGSTFDDFDPQRATFVGLFWTGTEFEEFFRFNPTADLAIDPDLTNAFSDQITVGFDQQLFEDLALTLRYVRKDDRDILGGENIGNDWIPVQTVTALGDPITLWAASPFFDPFRVLVNNPNSRFPHVGRAFRDYNGFQVKVTKRLADNWALIASYMIQKAEGNITNTWLGNIGSTSAFDTPNQFVNTPGELRNSRRHMFKLQASWLLPDPIRVLIGGQFDAVSSAHWDITQRFSRRLLGGIPSSDRTVPIKRIGSVTIDNMINLDIRAEKKFRLRGNWGDIGVMLDIFNVFNANTVIEIFQRVPFADEPTEIVTPRRYRFGLRWLF